MSDALVERLTEVLAGHAWWPGSPGDLPGCYCGFRSRVPGIGRRTQYETHVAQEQAAVVEQEIAAALAAALREAATSLGHIHQADSAGASACIRWLRYRAARIARTATQTPATSTEEGR